MNVDAIAVACCLGGAHPELRQPPRHHVTDEPSGFGTASASSTAPPLRVRNRAIEHGSRDPPAPIDGSAVDRVDPAGSAVAGRATFVTTGPWIGDAHRMTSTKSEREPDGRVSELTLGATASPVDCDCFCRRRMTAFESVVGAKAAPGYSGVRYSAQPLGHGCQPTTRGSRGLAMSGAIGRGRAGESRGGATGRIREAIEPSRARARPGRGRASVAVRRAHAGVTRRVRAADRMLTLVDVFRPPDRSRDDGQMEMSQCR